MKTLPQKAIRDILILFTITLVLNGSIFYADEGNFSIAFLTKPKEVVNLIIFTLFFSAFPLGIYNFLSESRYRKGAFIAAMVGYVPFVILVILVRS